MITIAKAGLNYAQAMFKPPTVKNHSKRSLWSWVTGQVTHPYDEAHYRGQGRAGQGRAGQGRAGQGRAGQGRAGQGRVGCTLTFVCLLSYSQR